MGIIEVIDACDLRCKTCIAGSLPGIGRAKAVNEIGRMIDALVKSEGGTADLVMISGGEPTLHPEILEILTLAVSKPVRRVMLITNGVRLAEEPDLCMTLSVDPRHLAALIVEAGLPAPRDDHDGRGIYVSPLEPPLLEALLRMVRLLDVPKDIPVLAPLVLRELHYRLLQGEQHGRLAEIAIGDGRLRRVAGAITWIKEHFTEPLQIDALAKQVNMSPSALHSHFKAVVAMSPLQYQKRLRLEEARRRLLADGASAEAVAYEVGYASPSQFSREYVRLFGEPPRRDAERMRERLGQAAPSS
jgi:AraC-like DNA-binding protein